MTVTFTPAVKEQLKARFALAGPSGSGKTYTALRLAKGLANGGKIALIDTERRSASLYADEFEFVTMDFSAPFRPDLLRDAIRAAEGIGAKVLIIDSFTHFWSGPGGVLEIVDQNAKGGNSWSGWAVGTPLQQQVVDAMLTADLHVIVCMRSKQEWALQTNSKGKQEPTRVGMGVQQRGDIEYEFTVFGELDLAHRLSITKTRCKKLTDRVESFPGEDLARELLDWLESGEDPNAAYVAAGWASQHAHEQARLGVVAAAQALTKDQAAALSAARKAAGIPSPGPSAVLTATQMRDLDAIIVAVSAAEPADADGDADADADGDGDGLAAEQATPEPDPERSLRDAQQAVADVNAANTPVGMIVYGELKARKLALDAEYAAEFDRLIAEAGVVGFTHKSNAGDAATVAGALDVVEKRNQPVWDARRREVFANLGRLPKMDDAARHAFVLAATEQTESTAKLTESQKDLIVAAVEDAVEQSSRVVAS